MIDINNILTQALTQALAAATAPLVERIAALETRAAAAEAQLMAARDRIAALENNPAQGVDLTLEKRIAALETHTVVLDQHGGVLEYLDNQEWFWEKLTRKAGEVAEAAAEQAMDHHLECYDHDSYDEATSKVDEHDFDEFVKTDDFDGRLREELEDVLNNCSLSVRF